MVVLGSLNLDLVARTERLPAPGETVSGLDYHEFPGGKGLNQAVAAARAGAIVALVGSVGDDSAGERLRSIVVGEGIDDRWLMTVSGTATGRAMITVDHAAENSIVVIAGANSATTWPPDAPTGDVILAQLEVPLDTIAAGLTAALRAGATTILNPAPAIALPRSLLARCSLIVPNEHEIELLGHNAAMLCEIVGELIVTRGEGGVDIVDAAGSVHVDAFDVAPVDTTGAGDAFCGNLAARLAGGAELLDAVRWGAAAGALAATTAGAVPSLPHQSATTQLVNRTPV